MKYKVYSSDIPANSQIARFLPADYTDVYSCETGAQMQKTADDILIGFWTDHPAWVRSLFKLRNFLVRFVGLEHSFEGPSPVEDCIRNGTPTKIMSVVAKDNDETVVLLSDSHLDAYLSVIVKDGEKGRTVEIATLVKYKKRIGKIYFFLVKPFHKIIVKSLVSRNIAKYTN